MSSSPRDSLGVDLAEAASDLVREDRRRLVGSRAFRRLAHKTQVIANPDNDHLGTRLTHTLEVAEIALSIARGLDPRGELLDHPLVEVIALAHDVGHPPFGHAGEGVLARLGAEAGVGGFHHASFGVRLLSESELERVDDGASVVRSASVLEGVLAHSKGKSGAVFAQASLGLQRRSSEALVVRAADLYAYASSDLDDAFRLGVFSPRDVPTLASRVLGTTGASVRRTLVERTVAATLAAPERGVHVDAEADEALAQLRAFLYERFYEGEATAAQTRLARVVLERIFRACERGLVDVFARLGRSARATDRPRTLRDAMEAIACMTDRFAIAFSESLA